MEKSGAAPFVRAGPARFLGGGLPSSSALSHPVHDLPWVLVLVGFDPSGLKEPCSSKFLEVLSRFLEFPRENLEKL